MLTGDNAAQQEEIYEQINALAKQKEPPRGGGECKGLGSEGWGTSLRLRGDKAAQLGEIIRTQGNMGRQTETHTQHTLLDVGP